MCPKQDPEASAALKEYFMYFKKSSKKFMSILTARFDDHRNIDSPFLQFSTIYPTNGLSTSNRNGDILKVTRRYFLAKMLVK